MNHVICITTIALLGIITWQDLKLREISWISIPVLFILLFYKGAMENDLMGISRFFFINLAIVGALLLLLTIYFTLKQGRLVNIVGKYIGLGDILMFVVMSAMLSPMNFILMYTLIVFVAVVGFIVVKLIKPQTTGEIPLAGIMALFMAAVLLIHDYTNVLNLYDDNTLIQSII